MADSVPVRHNTAESRYEAVVEGHLSVCEYEVVDDKMVFTHTLVPPELRGRGIAEQLVRAGLDDARKAGRKIVPACSYVAVFIRRHREYQDLLA
jgi:predicted GNAT family acetyltransferase